MKYASEVVERARNVFIEGRQRKKEIKSRDNYLEVDAKFIVPI